MNGTQDNICDPDNGMCHCLPGKNGLTCSSCALGYWEPSSELGCQPCNCCPNGSNSTVCNQVSLYT